MDSAKLNDWMQVLGIFAVVASLIFVGLQMKQSQEIAIATQYQDRFATAMEYWIGREQNEFRLRRAAGREMENHGLLPGVDEDASLEEIGSAISGVRQVLLMYDNMHFQYSAGFLTEESWRAQTKTLASFIVLPRYRHYVEQHSNTLRPSFHALCKQLIKESEPNER